MSSFLLTNKMLPSSAYSMNIAAVTMVLPSTPQALTSRFHRFLARFSGRRRVICRYPRMYSSVWAYLVTVLALVCIVDGCSSRTTPKPRPPAPTPRPNITFHTYTCPPAYAAWYCLNGAKCFTVKIGDSLIYNCECRDGYIGQRCEYKDLDGSYLSSQRKIMLETASIAGGASIAILLVVILCIVTYLHCKRLKKSINFDCADEASEQVTILHMPTFSTRWHNAFTTPELAARTGTRESDKNNWNIIADRQYPGLFNRDVCDA